MPHKPCPPCKAAPPAPVPPEWATRVTDGRMLYTHDDAKDVPHIARGGGTTDWGWHASVANGVVGTIIDSGTLYLAGTFNGPALSTTKEYAANFSAAGARPHLAKVPSHMAVRIANATVQGCAIDLERGLYLRRSVTVDGALIEQRFYAHRVRKSVIVMEMELLGNNHSSATLTTDVGLQLYSIGNFSTNVDVNWAHTDESPTADMWQRVGVTKQNENGSTPGVIRLAYVSTRVPTHVHLTQGVPRYWFGVVGSSIMKQTRVDGTSPIQAATKTWNTLTALDDASKAALRVEHETAWLGLWKFATIELETERTDIKRAINSTLYGMLSLHDETDTVPFPGSPLDGITLGSFGHWGGCYLWDADMWMYPVLALWRPDFMGKMLQYRVDRLPGAYANAKLYGMRGAKIPVMTCGTGAEATTSNGNVTVLGRNEIHESGDVVFEAQQHWRLTGRTNRSWVTAVGLPLASAVADYYVSRASTRPGSTQLHMDAVCGPE